MLNPLRFVFLVSVVATVGSLFFSEVMKLPPCVLCWYQRIAMYPLVLIFASALVFNTKDVFKYGLGLSLCGLVISIFHNLIYYGFISESISPCVQGVSCTAVQLQWLGFITIPLLSLAGFTLISSVSFYALMRGENNEKQ